MYRSIAELLKLLNEFFSVQAETTLQNYHLLTTSLSKLPVS